MNRKERIRKAAEAFTEAQREKMPQPVPEPPKSDGFRYPRTAEGMKRKARIVEKFRVEF